MTTNKLTDETLSAWKTEAKISLGETARDSVDYSHHEAILALVTEIQEHRKAAAEPVLYVMGMGCAFDAETASTCKGAVDSWVGEWNQERLPGQEEYKTVPLYATPQPLNDAEWAELQERRKADSAEPIYQWREAFEEDSLWDDCTKSQYDGFAQKADCEVRILYTAPPASEREHIRREHAEWSDATFGDVGLVGPLKHLSKEALETAAEPDDLSEWADMQFLFWDAQRRAGITDEQITRALTEKLAINKARQWPEPKDGEPRLHIKEQPAPVIPAAWYDIMSERLRQIHMEGWAPEHDDTYDGGELAGAAACYARHVSARGWVYAENPAAYQDEDVPGDWPWAEEWWKPTTPYRDLEKAGALILAEMERINRVTGAGEGGAVVGEVSRG
ncbi:DUF550 domain-containing protein [Salmonella enterica]|nr:DUF550 domain-containing protein [Salmonella enterica]